MSFALAVFIYILIWWLMLFTVLPFGVRAHGEGGKGFDSGAPINPDLKRKLIINSILSAVILAVIQILVMTGVINWHGMFAEAIK